MRRHLKRLAERALVASGAVALARVRRRDDVLVLAYHDIVASEADAQGDASLHLTRDAFVSQLDALSRTHDVVPVSEILVVASGRHRPRAAITFDDAYHGALTLGIPELVRRGMPATVFVAPGLLGRRPWWDLLADAKEGAVPPTTRDRALGELAGDGDAVARWARSEGILFGNPTARIATESELAAAADMPGVTLGSHSWSHANLRVLPPDAVARELQSSMAWLRERFRSFVPWLSYPYGLHSPAVEAAAAAHGYAGAFRIDGGWVERSASRTAYAVPRYNVPAGLSLDGFRLRLGGVRSRS